MTADEISSFFHFPQNPKKETSMLTVKARKLALPIGVPTFGYKLQGTEIIAQETPPDITIM